MPRIRLNKKTSNSSIATTSSSPTIAAFVMILCLMGILGLVNQNSGLRSLACSSKEQTSSSSSSASFDMAYRDSGGFFDDISDEQWKLMKDRVEHRKNHFRSDPKRFINSAKMWYQENFEPDFTCSHERRIGGMGDGPKWVCDPHRLAATTKGCLVYSVGSAGDFGFENSVISEIGNHCEIHTFDPEMTGRQYGHLAPAGVQYHNWGFMSESGTKGQIRFDPSVIQNRGSFKTMKETITELGHTGRVIDIFKIDCEGCEWTTFDGWFDAGATLRQIQVEVHQSPEDKVFDFFLRLQKAGYVTFHKEPNTEFADGNCVEYAFLKLENSFFHMDA